MIKIIAGIKLLSFVALFIICIPYASMGQELVLKGVVKNTEGKLLSNVILTKKYKNKPAEISTVSSGTFAIKLSDTTNLEAVSFSYLGYTTSTIKTKDALLFIQNNPNADFIVILKAKPVDLNQVVITDKHPFYQNENASVFDYEIMPNGNLILVMEKRILLINPQDSILKTIPNTMEIDEIIKACSGRIFLRNKTLLYPTYISDTSLRISNDPVEINSSLKQINELIACDTVIKIKERVSSHNQKVTYKLQPLSDPSVEVNLYVAQNKQQMKWANTEKAQIDRYDSLAKLEEVPTEMTATFSSNMVGGGSSGKKGVQSNYDEMVSVVWPQDSKVWKYEFFTSKKLYAPIFLLHDSIYIFDHAINKIVAIAYNKEGNTLKLNTILKDSITYHKKKGWQKIVLQDSYTGEFFTLYRNERLVLNNILLFGDKKQIEITLPKGHLFANNIKIYNHTAYYLWRDLTNETSIRTLYKVSAQ